MKKQRHNFGKSESLCASDSNTQLDPQKKKNPTAYKEYFLII